MTDQDDKLRDTTPPPRSQTEPSALSEGSEPRNAIPPQAAVPEPQPNPNSYADFVLAQLLASSRTLEAERKAIDFKGLLDKQAEHILRETSADIGLIRSSITGLQQSVDALVTRVGSTETALDAGIKRFDRIDNDMAAIRVQMNDLKARIADIEAEQRRMKEGPHVAETTAAPTTG